MALTDDGKDWAQKIRALQLDQIPDDQLPTYTGPVRLHPGFPNTDWVQAAGVFRVRRINGIYSWHGAVVIPSEEFTHDVTALAGGAVIRVNILGEEEDEAITNALGLQRDEVVSHARYWFGMLMGAGAPRWSVPAELVPEPDCVDELAKPWCDGYVIGTIAKCGASCRHGSHEEGETARWYGED